MRGRGLRRIDLDKQVVERQKLQAALKTQERAAEARQVELALGDGDSKAKQEERLEKEKRFQEARSTLQSRRTE